MHKAFAFQISYIFSCLDKFRLTFRFILYKKKISSGWLEKLLGAKNLVISVRMLFEMLRKL